MKRWNLGTITLFNYIFWGGHNKLSLWWWCWSSWVCLKRFCVCTCHDKSLSHPQRDCCTEQIISCEIKEFQIGLGPLPSLTIFCQMENSNCVNRWIFLSNNPLPNFWCLMPLWQTTMLTSLGHSVWVIYLIGSHFLETPVENLKHFLHPK